jgi:hypothetical protein
MAVRSQLVEILAEQAMLSSTDLERAALLQQEHGGSLAEILVREGLAEEDDLFFVMSRQLGVPAIPEERLHHLTLAPEIRRRVPRALARSAVLVPLDLEAGQGILSVALFDPSDPELLDQLRQTARVSHIRPYIARRKAILAAIKAVYTEDDEVGPDPETLPILGPSETPPATPLPEPPTFESKVELDPALAEEIAALSGPGAPLLSRSAKALRPPAPRSPRAARTDQLPPSMPPPPPDADEKFTEDVSLPELRGRSLLRARREDEATNPFGVYPRTVEPADEVDDVDLGIPYEEPVEGEGDYTPPVTVVTAAPLPEAVQADLLDSLLRELLSSVGILVAMLQERIDPAGGNYREFGRISRLVARELGMDEITISRVALAAHLYGLDVALRREVGVSTPLEVVAAFGAQPSAPGGLGPSLRTLGAKALGIVEGEPDPAGAALIRLVADYLALRAESEEGVYDLETVAQLLRTGGGDPVMIDALVRAVESSDTARVRLDAD